MCTPVDTEGRSRVRSGGSRTTRYSDSVRVGLVCYNYVVYERLGSNLESGFLSIISCLLNGSTQDFFYIDSVSPENLRALFHADRDSDIPSSFRRLVSSEAGSWIYFYIDSGHGQPDELIEVQYTSETSWTANIYRWVDGDIQRVNGYTGDGELFYLSRTRLPETRAIAFPYQISALTAVNILLGRGIFDRGLSALRSFCLVQAVHAEDLPEGAEFQLVIFDPGRIISQTAGIIHFYSRYMQVINPRSNGSRLSEYDRRIRKKGILATILKELSERDSSLSNDLNQSALDSAFNRYANYGYRKGLFIDNIYNFLNHDILTRIEEVLMTTNSLGIHSDGYVWLRMISPLAEIAGDHMLLSEYFLNAGDKDPDKSSFSMVYHSAFESGWVDNSSLFDYWNDLLQGHDLIKITLAVAQARTYYLVDEYSGGRISWREFEHSLSQESRNVLRVPPYIQRSTEVRAFIGKVNQAFTFASRLSQVAALLKGDISSGTFTTALDALAEYAEGREAVSLAVKFCFVKNVIDIGSHSADFYQRIGMEDYDAALGHGMVIAAGLTELGYLAVTGTLLGGPAGLAVAVVGSVGSIVALLATDSDFEEFAHSCLWGAAPHQSSAHPDWSVSAFNQYTDTDEGVDIQLKSLMNLLHKFENVRDAYDQYTHVVAIEIDTKFLPDTALFVVKAEFTGNTGICRGTIRLRFPSRTRAEYTQVTPHQTGERLITGANTMAVTEDDHHTIKINIGVQANLSDGKIWLCCYPFNNSEFPVPSDNKGVYLQNCVEPRIFSRGHDFEASEWRTMPSW